MDRIFFAGAAASPPTLPVSPSTGYPRGSNPGLGQAATNLGPYWYYMITEEIRNVIVAAGLTPAGNDVDQLTDAINALIIANAPGLPPGTVIHVAQSVAPSGYLKANGAAVSRSSYAELFAAIGTAFGAGDGSTTFNLPDLRGEFIRGLDDGRGVDSGRAIGQHQKSTVLVVGSGPTLDVSTTYSVSNGSGARADAGLDTVNAADYPNIRNNSNPSPALSSPLSDADFSYGGTRPRNQALLACIKY